MRPDSSSKRLTTSSIDMRFEGILCQHRWTIYHTRSEISKWSFRDGLSPFSIACAAAISVIPKNGGRPVSTYLE